MEVNQWKRKLVVSMSFETCKKQLALSILLYVTLFIRGLVHGYTEVLSNSLILCAALTLC